MKIAIFGASGFGRELADICIEIGYTDIVFLVKDDPEIINLNNTVYQDNKKNIEDLNNMGYSFAIGIGDPKIRKLIFEKYPSLHFPNIIHPSVTFGKDQKNALEKSKGILITAGCRLTNNIVIGNFVLINLNTTIGHDCIIEDFVSIMPNVTICGNVHIKNSAYIGCSSSIVQGTLEKKIMIGKNSTVGMGSIVLRSVKDQITVFGNPAREYSKTKSLD